MKRKIALNGVLSLLVALVFLTSSNSHPDCEEAPSRTCVVLEIHEVEGEEMEIPVAYANQRLKEN